MAKRTDELARLRRLVRDALPLLEAVGAALAEEPSEDSRAVDGIIARMRAAVGRAGVLARSGLDPSDRALWTRTMITEDLAVSLEPGALRELLGAHHEQQIRMVISRRPAVAPEAPEVGPVDLATEQAEMLARREMEA